MVRVELEPAFVLHRRAYRETSLLVEVLTPAHGRVGLVARGARRPGARGNPLLQPFRPLLLSWTGRGDLATLGKSESAGRTPSLSGVALVSGLYLNELLMRLTHRHDPHEPLFQAYGDALFALEAGRASGPEPVLRVFEKRLLEALGYGLVLDHEAATGACVDARTAYDYRREEGPCRLSPGAEAGGVRVTGETLLALHREALTTPASLREAKALMRHVLGALLGERPLNSRELLRGPPVRG